MNIVENMHDQHDNVFFLDFDNEGLGYLVLFCNEIYTSLLIIHCRYHSHHNDYLEICRCYKAIYDIPSVKENTTQWIPVKPFSLLDKYRYLLHLSNFTTVGPEENLLVPGSITTWSHAVEPS